jgi:acyl-coenzyme A thioesterase PaaI-like protein
MFIELKKGKAVARMTVLDERQARERAKAMVKRWGEPVTVYHIRKHDGRKRFICKMKHA